METNARQAKICDGCNTEISEAQLGQPPIPLSHDGPVSANLVDWRDPSHPQRTHHFHNEGCLSAYLKVREMEQKNHAHASLSNIAELKTEKSNTFWSVDLLAAHGMTEKEKKQHYHENKPYGDVEYADSKNHKYPIDTEEHVRAALSYINHPKNAAEYSSSELSAIKSKIHSAAKKFGIQVNASEEMFASTTVLKNKIYYTKCGHWVNIAAHCDSYDKLDMQEPKDEYCFGCRVKMGMK